MQANSAYPSVLFLSALAMTARAQHEVYPIKPHPHTQELIAKWASPPATPGIEQRHYAILGPLSQLAARDSERFVQQVIYFVHQQEQNEERGGRIILARNLIPLCQVSDASVAIALAPYLYAQHAGLRKSAWDLLLYGQRGNYPPGYTDLSYLADAARSDNEEIAMPVRRAIFEVAPNAAFRLFMREAKGAEVIALLRAQRTLENQVFEQKLTTNERQYRAAAKERGEPDGDLEPPARWVLDDNSILALRELATSKHWWARMFASEFMFRHEEFRIPELIEKLEQDDNELVRNSAVSITTPDPLRSPKVLLMPLPY